MIGLTLLSIKSTQLFQMKNYIFGYVFGQKERKNRMPKLRGVDPCHTQIQTLGLDEGLGFDDDWTSVSDSETVI